MTGNHLLGHDPAEDLLCSTWIGEEKERTVGGAVLSLFLLVTKRLYGKEREWSIGQIKTCRKKQHVKIDGKKEMSELICGKAAVGGNYNSTRDMVLSAIICSLITPSSTYTLLLLECLSVLLPHPTNDCIHKAKTNNKEHSLFILYLMFFPIL